jgi:ubiquinone/menaquinone biosynthesis C-methylase UbiE
MTNRDDVNEWRSAEHAQDYLRRADTIPHRTEGEGVLLELIPEEPKRILDVGSGAGRLLSLVKAARPHAEFVAVDFSPTMLQVLRDTFGKDRAVTIVEHDFAQKLPDMGAFDCVVSSFAIHHVRHERKRELYEEIFGMLAPSGVFCNLEHVSSPTARAHEQFLAKLGIKPEQEDPSNKLLDAHTQLRWLQDIGFEDVDCYWKWREFALLAGRKPGR